MSTPSRSILLLASLALAVAGACKREAAPAPSPAPPSAVARPTPAPSPAPPSAVATLTPAADIPTLQPDELARMLGQPGEKPLLFHVGFRKLYEQAHIPGSEYLGPTSDARALDHLRQRVAALPRTASIVIYCGCCPWERCPNVHLAYEALRELGFTNAKVLFIAKDLGTDWVARGFPVARGE